jgi:hypothetical protein
MEQLVLIAIFLLVGFVNAIVRWLRQRAAARRREAEPEALPVPGPAPSRTRELPPGARVVLPPPPAEVRTPAAQRRMPALQPPVRRRPREHRRLGSRADVRRAVVMMTVLAPCRAREHEPEVGTSSPPRT